MTVEKVKNGSRREYINGCDINTNYTTIYLLPMLGYPESFFPKESFISAYILENPEKKLVLCFDNYISEEFTDMINKLQNHKDFFSIDYDDNEREVVVIFTIPKDREIDYNLFKIGRYTKLSNEYKEILLEYHGRKSGAGKCIMMIDSLYPDHMAKQYRADKMSAFYIGAVRVSINDLPGGETMSRMDDDREFYIPTNDLIKRKESEVGK